MNQIIKKKKICWLIGNPVEHSLSPGMHQIIYDALDLPDWEYNKRKINDKKELGEFVEEVRREGYVGFNVTVPYKQDIMQYLDKIDPVAESIGAVNTVLNRDGVLEGINTDCTGFKNDVKLLEPLGAAALVIGAGGAGRAVIAGLLDIMNTVYVYELNSDKVEHVKKDFPKITAINKEEEIYNRLSEGVTLLVNATPVGMREGDPSVVRLKDKVRGEDFKVDLKVYDVVYNRKTELLKEAEEIALKNSDGIGMLAGQGAEAFKWWSYIAGVTNGPNEIDDNIIEEMKEYLIREVYKND